jgi:hypothetical protein
VANPAREAALDLADKGVTDAGLRAMDRGVLKIERSYYF